MNVSTFARRPRFAGIALAAATLAAVAPVALGQAAATRPADVDEAAVPTLRTYDVSDLIRATRDYPIERFYSRGGGGGGGGGSDVEKAGGGSAGGMSVEFLQSLISETVASDSWKENGGTVGSMRTLPSALVVSQTPANQVGVEELLRQLRAEQGTRTMVSLRASWLLLDAQTVRGIYDRARKARADDDGATMGPAVVDEATITDAPAYGRGQNTCFSGQTVSILSQRQWRLVSDLTPIVGSGAVGYQAQTERAESGATLQFTPRLVPGGGVIVDLRSDVSETRGPTPADGPIDPVALGTAAATRPTIDRQDTVRQTIATTVRLPLGKPILVAGMTLEPTSLPRADARQLYLVLEVDAVR